MSLSKEAVIRMIMLVLALINQGITSAGKNPLPFAEDTMYELLSLLFTAGMSLWGFWKNNSFTKAAKLGDMVMTSLKKG